MASYDNKNHTAKMEALSPIVVSLTSEVLLMATNVAKETVNSVVRYHVHVGTQDKIRSKLTNVRPKSPNFQSNANVFFISFLKRPSIIFSNVIVSQLIVCTCTSMCVLVIRAA